MVGQIFDKIDASELPELEREFQHLVHSGPGQHHPHHGHLRRQKRASLFAAPSVTEAQAVPQDLLEGRHPSVTSKLAHMKQEVSDLKGRKQAAEATRGELESHMTKASHHMGKAVLIKRELARTEARLRAEGKKIKRLEDDRLRLDRTHDHLVSSLHHIMEPKIDFAESTLTNKQRKERSLEAMAAEWEIKERNLHEAALEKLEERKKNKMRLDAANELEVKAHHEKEVAKKKLDESKHGVVSIVQTYKFAQTHAQASKSQEKRATEARTEQEKSVKRLRSILRMEERRVDESMAIGKDRVRGRINELEAIKRKSASHMVKLSKEYTSWQEKQRAWARRVAAAKAVAHGASKEFVKNQREVLDAAQAKVAQDAEDDSDWAWNEWPGQKKTDTEEVDVTDF